MTAPALPNSQSAADPSADLLQWEQFSKLIEDGVLLVDFNQVVQFVNPSASQLFGEELRNRALSDLFKGINFDDVFDNIENRQRPHEFIYKHKKTVRRQFRIKMMAVGAHHVGVLVMDMTLQRNLDKVRRDFVANVSHELRSPLTSLIGFIETLRETDDIDHASQAHFLAIMDEESKRMTRLIDDLISLSRVEVEEHILPAEQVHLDEVITNVVAILSGRAQKRDMTISFDNHIAGHASQSQIQGERDEIVEVFHNLIENAIKYGFDQSAIDISLKNDDAHHVVCEVTNKGEGIEARHIPRLTERFYRVDKARSRQQGGTGLGLAIVKHIVNRHRGQLTISSIVGESTTFTVKFPILKKTK